MVCRGLVRSWFGSVVVVRVGPVGRLVRWYVVRWSMEVEFGSAMQGGRYLVRHAWETSWFGIDVVGLVRHGGGEVRFGIGF